jgi:glutaredoxin-like protein NrdH
MITVYTKPSCPACTGTRRYLDKLEIPHEIVDLTQDAAAAAYVQSLGYSSAPVVVAGQDHWSGLRPDRIARLATGDAHVGGIDAGRPSARSPESLVFA